MNVNIWDVTKPIQQLIHHGLRGRTVNLDRLTDPAAPLADLTT